MLRSNRFRAAAFIFFAAFSALFANSVAHSSSAPADVSEMEKSVVRIVNRTARGVSTGTGFILNSDGYIATNHHVIAGGGQLYVLPNNSTQQIPVEIVGVWRELDIAIIKVSGFAGNPVKINKQHIKKGDPVFAVGFPGIADRLATASDATITEGIVGRIFESTWSERGSGIRLTIIQHSAAVNPGNSGGPLFDSCGRVVGINTQASPSVIRGRNTILPALGVLFASHIKELVRKLDEKSISYTPDDTPCDISNVDSEAREQAEQAGRIATQIGGSLSRLVLWIGILSVVLLITLVLALRKPRERVVRVVERYSRKLSKPVKRLAGKGGLLLVGFSETGHPLRIELSAGSLKSAKTGISVGRVAVLVDIATVDRRISRRHARFSVSKGIFYVEDLNSTNGTVLNGKRLKPFEPEAVNAGDTLTLGGVEFSISRD